MAGTKPSDLKLLEPALEAARRALRKLDDEHVPARLRAVASQSGRLPPPMARRLLAELEKSEWLRAEAVNQWPQADLNDPNPARAISALFLVRPNGWEELVTDVSVRARTAEEVGDRRHIEEELQRALSRISDLQERLEVVERRRAEIEARQGEELSRAQARYQRSVAGHKGQTARLQRQLDDTQAEREQLAKANQELTERAAHLRQKRAKGPSTGGRETASWPRTEALALARQLDDLLKASVVMGADNAGAVSTFIPGHLQIPKGTRPDRAEALRWLLSISQPVTVAIDGWNVAHHLSSPPGAKERERVTEAARRIAIGSVGKRRLVVVFDSKEGNLPIGDYRPPQTVEARYVASADEEIIEMGRQDPRDLVVVTSDRRVRESVQAAGAIGLWSEALIEWLGAGGWK